MEYDSTLKRNEPPGCEETWRKRKRTSVSDGKGCMRPVGLQLYDTQEKAKPWRQKKDQWFSDMKVVSRQWGEGLKASTQSLR